MKYNILYIHNKASISGGERSLLNLWRSIDKDSFNLFVILPGTGDLSKKAAECGVEVLYSKVPKLTSRNIFKITAVLSRWLGYVHGKKIHLIHSYTPRNNILSGIVGRLLSKPVIWHERNLMYDGDKFDVTKKFLFLPEGVICNSRAVAERFRTDRGIPEKVKVVYNGVDLDKYCPFLDSSIIRKKLYLNDRKVVGVVSNLSKRKRVEFFLKAAAKIKESYGNVAFVVVGGSFPREDNRMMELKETAFLLGIDKDVVFTGFQEDINGFISVFDVSVNVTDKEACSRAIIESMACGKAVVAMDDGGSPELIENGVNGILTHPMRISDFADSVVGLLNNEEKRKLLGERARRTAENKFSIRRNTKETQELYLSLIEPK